jgi:hypothetical protein
MAASRAPWRFESRGGKIVCPLPWTFGWLTWVRAREYFLWLSERGAGLDSGH